MQKDVIVEKRRYNLRSLKSKKYFSLSPLKYYLFLYFLYFVFQNKILIISSKVRLSTVEFENKKTLKYTVFYRKQSLYQLYVNITIETIANTN